MTRAPTCACAVPPLQAGILSRIGPLGVHAVSFGAESGRVSFGADPGRRRGSNA